MLIYWCFYLTKGSDKLFQNCEYDLLLWSVLINQRQDQEGLLKSDRIRNMNNLSQKLKMAQMPGVSKSLHICTSVIQFSFKIMFMCLTVSYMIIHRLYWAEFILCVQTKTSGLKHQL